MQTQTPYLTSLRELLETEISRPTPTRMAIQRLIEAIPKDSSQADLPGLISARESLDSALNEDLDRQRQRVGLEVFGLLKELMIPMAMNGKHHKTSPRISTKEASVKISAFLNRTGPEPQTRLTITSQTGLSASTTKRALALLIENKTAAVDKKARVHTYKMQIDHRASPADQNEQP
ncbi:MAG: hypothetical protein AAGI37_14150 [Planctomycetota bacterium]